MGHSPTLVIVIDHSVEIPQNPGSVVALGDVVLRRAVTGELQIQWFGDEPRGMRRRLEASIASYLRGHAEEAPSGDMRAALFWAAEHIESGDYMAQEAPPEKEG